MWVVRVEEIHGGVGGGHGGRGRGQPRGGGGWEEGLAGVFGLEGLVEAVDAFALDAHGEGAAS
jgi:hypothetical protein